MDFIYHQIINAKNVIQNVNLVMDLNLLTVNLALLDKSNITMNVQINAQKITSQKIMNALNVIQNVMDVMMEEKKDVKNVKITKNIMKVIVQMIALKDSFIIQQTNAKLVIHHAKHVMDNHQTVVLLAVKDKFYTKDLAYHNALIISFKIKELVKIVMKIV